MHSSLVDCIADNCQSTRLVDRLVGRVVFSTTELINKCKLANVKSL